MPIGMPGWPLFAACTASIDKARMALASEVVLMSTKFPSVRAEAEEHPRAPGLLYRRSRQGQPSPLAAGDRHAIVTFVADQRALDAVARIERALARIEHAATRPPPARNDAEHERLLATHDQLKRQVAGALAQLDSLISAGERG